VSNEHPVIAVIDDEEAVRKALRRLLRSAGLSVVTFSGGREFLASLASARPDCAVLDLHMPDVTGFDVLERLTEMKAGVPVIVVTGQDSPDAEARVMRSGAAAYVRKPVDDRVLLDTIAAAMS
jgi:FixJ family two-component response regulator